MKNLWLIFAMGVMVAGCALQEARFVEDGLMPPLAEIERVYRQSENETGRICRVQIDGLWEKLKIAAFQINSSEHPSYAAAVGFYYDGKIEWVPSFGGYGFMSGVVIGDGFYYTYSWGSGIHRSHVAMIRRVNGKLEHWDSGGFTDWNGDLGWHTAWDLFVIHGAEGKPTVLVGSIEHFDIWTNAMVIGTIHEAGDHTLQLIDGEDREIKPFFPPKEGGQ